MDDDEQVVALEAAARQLGVGHGHQRVGVPDDQRAHRRVERRVGERLAEPAHVEPARLAPGEQVGPGRARPRRRRRRGTCRRCATARRRRRATHRRAPAARRACGRTSPRSRGARRRSACGSPPGGSCRSRGPARSMVAASRPQTAAARAGVHSATWAASSSKPTVWSPTHSWSTRPSRISTCIIASISAMSVPGQRLDELVGGVRGDRAQRVDDHDPGAVGPGRLDGRPQVAVGEPGVRAPQDDQAGVAQLERRRACARCRWSSDTRRPPSDRTARARAGWRPRWWKKRPSRPITDSRLWLPASLNGSTASAPWVSITSLQAGGDLGERVVPRDRLELALALGSDPAQRRAGCGRGCTRGRGSG